MGSSRGSGGKGGGLFESILNPVGYVIPAFAKFDPITQYVAPSLDSIAGTHGQNYYDKESANFAELMASVAPPGAGVPTAVGQNQGTITPVGQQLPEAVKTTPGRPAPGKPAIPPANRTMLAPKRRTTLIEEEDEELI